MQEMKDVLQDAGCKVIVMDSENKSLYHCGAVVVSNLVTGLYSLGVHILQNCGFEENDAQKALIPLFLGNAKAVAEKGPVDALTGRWNGQMFLPLRSTFSLFKTFLMQKRERI